MRPIDADAIQYTMIYRENWMRGTGGEEQAAWKSTIDAMPTIEPERKKGKWIYDMNGYYECSECHIKTLIPDNGSAFVDDSESYHFCRWCGAYMRGEQE
jgi:hypothetical protein